METLEHTENPFGGIVVSPEALPSTPQAFRQLLVRSLEVWKGDGAQAVWLEVPIGRSSLIPIAVDLGFTFHHSGDDYMMMTVLLVEGSYIPPYATHYIGAGGVVLNDRDELLVVCEKHRRGGRPYFKLPGGALHPGEHLAAAVVREVLEETGIRTRFDALICFRHWHEYRHGKSDIYFVCKLGPLNHDIIKQDEEIEECRWMPVEDYLNSDYVGAFNRHIVQAALKSPGLVLTDIEGYSDPERREIFMPPDAELE